MGMGKLSRQNEHARRSTAAGPTREIREPFMAPVTEHLRIHLTGRLGIGLCASICNMT